MPIKKLPQNVASKIAAGEVVERPVSVIKELIENAIDAQATEITIKIEDAGRKLIEVSDNGIGILSSEITLAIERYATSKIDCAEDLQQIKTLGFRGEALASICAVSRFSIASHAIGANVGHICMIEGGELSVQKEIGMPAGTKVVVRDLFFNVPARLKFLKSDRTEQRHINRVISRYALQYAQIRFLFIQDGKKVLFTNGNGDRVEILAQQFGVETARKMLPVKFNDGNIAISGFTSPYSLTRASRRDIFFFINGRLVSDASIVSAITRGYQGLIMVGRYPICVLFIEMAPDDLDVNVHPTKTEIRIKDASQVFSAVHRAIRTTISAYSPVPSVPPAIWRSVENDFTAQVPSASLFREDAWDESNTLPDDRQPAGKAGIPAIPLLRLIGQLGQTYLAAEGPDGLYLIDQHAAHERILYEELMKNGTSENTQFLLDAQVINLNQGDVEEIREKIEIAKDVGFAIEDFGPQAIKITGVPQILSKYDPIEAILGIIETDMDGTNGKLIETERKERIISRVCKRLAVKGGQRLSSQEQAQLLRDLESCDNPRTCPHGRPTIIHISVDALERRFGRTGSI